MTILNHTLWFPSRWPASRAEKSAKKVIGRGTPRCGTRCTVGRELRARHWDQQKQAGIDLLPVGDLPDDHVLTTSLLLGNVPARHQNKDG